MKDSMSNDLTFLLNRKEENLRNLISGSFLNVLCSNARDKNAEYQMNVLMRNRRRPAGQSEIRR